MMNSATKNEPQRSPTFVLTNTSTKMSKPNGFHTQQYVTKHVKQWEIKLEGMNLQFVTPIPELIKQLCEYKAKISQFKTQFRRTDVVYTHPQLVSIHNVLSNHTKIRTVEETERDREEYVTKYVKQWETQLKGMNLQFVTPIPELIKQLCEYKAKISHFKTQFMRTDVVYTHPQLVEINNVLNGNTKIRTVEEIERDQQEVSAKYHPRGADTGSDTETDRFFLFLQQRCPELLARYYFTATTRGALVDIIATSKIDPTKSFGLQIATAKLANGRSNFTKVIKMIRKYLDENIVVLLIAMIENQVVGVYMILPTPSVVSKLREFKESLQIKPTMLNKQNTPVGSLNNYLETFRYIHTDFQKGVQGVKKNFDDLSTDFSELCDKYPSIVNTIFYLSGLFLNVCQRTEWAYDIAYDVHVASSLRIKQTRIHGGRGDMLLEFDGKYKVIEERKILGISNGVDSNSYNLVVREPGQQGLDPLKVGVTTGFMRSDRSIAAPSEPGCFIAMVVLPVTTASGNIAIRPDKPASLTLSMSCDVANRDEYIEIIADKIGADAYPDHMQSTYTLGKKTHIRKIKAVFYFDTLTPGSKRLCELQELYKTFAERSPNAQAIQDYETAVNRELIDSEKLAIKARKK